MPERYTSKRYTPRSMLRELGGVKPGENFRSGSVISAKVGGEIEPINPPPKPGPDTSYRDPVYKTPSYLRNKLKWNQPHRIPGSWSEPHQVPRSYFPRSPQNRSGHDLEKVKIPGRKNTTLGGKVAGRVFRNELFKRPSSQRLFEGIGAKYRQERQKGQARQVGNIPSWSDDKTPKSYSRKLIERTDSSATPPSTGGGRSIPYSSGQQLEPKKYREKTPSVFESLDKDRVLYNKPKENPTLASPYGRKVKSGGGGLLSHKIKNFKRFANWTTKNRVTGPIVSAPRDALESAGVAALRHVPKEVLRVAEDYDTITMTNPVAMAGSRALGKLSRMGRRHVRNIAMKTGRKVSRGAFRAGEKIGSTSRRLLDQAAYKRATKKANSRKLSESGYLKPSLGKSEHMNKGKFGRIRARFLKKVGADIKAGVGKVGKPQYFTPGDALRSGSRVGFINPEGKKKTSGFLLDTAKNRGAIDTAKRDHSFKQLRKQKNPVMTPLSSQFSREAEKLDNSDVRSLLTPAKSTRDTIRNAAKRRSGTHEERRMRQPEKVSSYKVIKPITPEERRFSRYQEQDYEDYVKEAHGKVAAASAEFSGEVPKKMGFPERHMLRTLKKWKKENLSREASGLPGIPEPNVKHPGRFSRMAENLAAGIRIGKKPTPKAEVVVGGAAAIPSTRVKAIYPKTVTMAEKFGVKTKKDLKAAVAAEKKRKVPRNQTGMVHFPKVSRKKDEFGRVFHDSQKDKQAYPISQQREKTKLKATKEVEKQEIGTTKVQRGIKRTVTTPISREEEKSKIEEHLGAQSRAKTKAVRERAVREKRAERSHLGAAEDKKRAAKRKAARDRVGRIRAGVPTPEAKKSHWDHLIDINKSITDYLNR